MYVCTPYTCLVPREVRMGAGSLELELQMLWAVTWMLGTELRVTEPSRLLLHLPVKDWNLQTLVTTSTTGNYWSSRSGNFCLFDKITPSLYFKKNHFIVKNSQMKHSQIKATIQTSTCLVPEPVHVIGPLSSWKTLGSCRAYPSLLYFYWLTNYKQRKKQWQNQS